MGIRFPEINKCYCCCCMNFDVAIKVCTIIMAILYGLSTIYSISNIFTLFYSIVILVSLIFLAIGLFNGKLSYMKQFIYVFLVNLILEGISIILLVVVFFFFKDAFSKILNQEAATQSYNNAEFNMQYQKNTEAINTVVNTMLVFSVVTSVIFYGLSIYYYICTGSYIQTFEKELEKSDEARKLENNQY
ncbi:hypothetical protein H8356DRAFT_1640875 [Neocallimastix lanati (nom. inval.)]|uniref:Uncharacterized protein n=1 Tax=Neocallimastix californiae TaxID=1754190 RepID=A0A1Y2FUT2_9FUNG|nr:hypothetical protein H8356DRAFT_1640875 [Neocallimastix sp. JGI-2020a]ORY87327.1 hypothetical protein LY90DRAFT_663038 [Neocallimastix californiae]|eukprot:ORY87327.1 hypothetical protein LY90DRAFT_663038 [Neocallimastix californiae]